MNRLINVGLRGVTLASKFVLIFFLARFITPAELGLYGLVTATIGYALYFLGLDFYTFSTREILKHERAKWGALLKNQLALSLILYAVVIPLLIFIFVFGLLPWSVAFWFFALLALEHINQELSRLLIAISEQITASVVLLLRSGLWAIVIAVWMFFDPAMRALEYVFLSWVAGGVLAAMLGVCKLSIMGIGDWHKVIDWAWVRQGLRIALPLLVGTLALRGVFTIDRYWFETLAGMEVLGAYVLFMGMTTALMSFLDAGVFAFKYPALICAFHATDREKFRHEMKWLFYQTLAVTMFFTVVSLLVIDPLLAWLGRSTYVEHQYLFYWLLAIMLAYAIGMVPHYGLYARGQDRPLVVSHIVAVIIFVVITFVFSYVVPQLAVPIGLLVSFTAILVWKSFAFYRATSDQRRDVQFD